MISKLYGAARGVGLAVALALAGGALAAKPADARVFFEVGVGVPVYYGHPYFYHPYYRPYVVVAPPPVVYVPPAYGVAPAPGFTCYAGPYICPLPHVSRINGPCSCPAPGGYAGGVVR